MPPHLDGAGNGLAFDLYRQFFPARHSEQRHGKPVRSQAVMMSWQVQQRWMNELLADRSTALEADRPKSVSPKSRTENNDVMAA